MNRLFPPVSPRLPLATLQYDKQAVDQTNNILRLYFNQLDNVLGSLVGAFGGQYINSPCGQFSATATQAITAANMPYIVALDSTDMANGISLASNRITVPQSGIYNVQYALQFENTATSITEVWAWFRKNGVDIPNTATSWSVTERHGAVNGYVLASTGYFVDLSAGDYLETVVAAAAVGMNVEYYAASTSPFARPAVPAAVVTVTFVSAKAT